MAVRVLEGDWVKTLQVGRRVKPIADVKLEAGTPLTDAEDLCWAKVKKGVALWWVTCSCGEARSRPTWKAAYRFAYRHVRVSRLISLAMLADLDEEPDCD